MPYDNLKGVLTMKKPMIAGLVTADDDYKDYCKAFEELGQEPFISLNLQDLDLADALILPGSGQDMNPKLWGSEDQCSNDINDALDAAQWALMDSAVKKGKPILGICRGMQFINVYFGGTLIQDLPCSASHKAATPEQYHDVLHLPATFMEALYGETSEVNTRHHQGIGRIGENLQVISIWNDGEDSVVEAIACEQHSILGLQWHPEKMFLYGNENQRTDAKKLLQWFLTLEGEK